MKKQRGLNMNMGTASILLILLVFVLAAFSVRSIKAANHERILAEKTVSSIQTYYEADSKAQTVLYHLDEMLISNEKEQWADKVEEINQQLKEECHFDQIIMEQNKDEKVTFSFAVNMGEKSALQVEAQAEKRKPCHITKWRMVTEKPEISYELEEDVELWDGNVDIEE